MSSEDKVKVWASIGITKNLGNYESLRLDAGAECYADALDDKDAWAKLWESIDSQIEAKLNEIDLGK